MESSQAVGTYMSEEEAHAAGEHLRSVGVEQVTVQQLSSDSWQVEVPGAQRQQALDELQRMEQHRIPDSW